MSIRTTDRGLAAPGSPRGRRSSRWIVLAVVVVLVVVAAAAALVWPDDQVSQQVGPAPTTSAVATTVAPDPEAATRAAILDAYRKAFDAFVAVASDPKATPEDPRLAEHKTGNALTAAQAGIFRLRTDGQIFTGTVELHPTVVEMGGGTAIVTDCAIDRTATVELKTGKIISPPGTEGHASTAKMRVDAAGVWKQYDFKDERRSCVPPVS